MNGTGKTDELAEFLAHVGMVRELNAQEDRTLKVHGWALDAAVHLGHHLPSALTPPTPQNWDPSDTHGPVTASQADEVNEMVRKVEHATVARTLRIAEQFADYIRTGMSGETKAQLELGLGDDLGA